MNIFNYRGKELEEKLDEILSKITPEQLLEDLKECGLELEDDNIKNNKKSGIDKLDKSMERLGETLDSDFQSKMLNILGGKDNGRI